jgi:hypothetical protein
MTYDWNTEFTRYTNNKAKYITGLPISLQAIKSCIEADNPEILKELIGDHMGAHIYSLYSCFTLVPSVKCIEFIISEGTPLDRTFVNNPYGEITPIQHFNLRFNTTVKQYMRARRLIELAIEKGKKNLRKISFDSHTALLL